jgi:hypothetical protein
MFNSEMVVFARNVSKWDAAKVTVARLGSHRIAFDRYRTRFRRSDVTRLFGAFAKFSISVQSRRKIELLPEHVGDSRSGQVAFDLEKLLRTPHTSQKHL